MSDMRAKMVAALAEHLDIGYDRASEALDAVWEATKDVEKGAPASWQPDLSDPAQALAHRVQMAIQREFDGEELFPTCVVVQDPMTGRVGLAATALTLGDVDHFLMLGRGAARRVERQHGPS